MGTEDEEPDCHKQFRAAVSVIQNLPKNGSYRPSYEEMLRFYSYYKQATTGPCLVPRPGFWDPIGRYKWDAWNSLGKMSREEAMSAYITEMKLVAKKVIPDMPKPPETFLRRVTGWKDQIRNRDDGAVLEPRCHSRDPAFSHPEAQPPRDLDLEVFCDSLEQLESELPHPGTWDSSQQVWAEHRGAAGGEPETRTSPESPSESPSEKEMLRGSLLGPQELDKWLMGTVRALQESMQDVQGRLQSLESKPQPPKQEPVSLSSFSWNLGLDHDGGSWSPTCQMTYNRLMLYICPQPGLGLGPSGSRLPRCSSCSCGPSLSSGSSDSFGPRRGDCGRPGLQQWRRLGAPVLLCLSLPRV
ncbi:acyl-CoA-binding domain-containing protein 4 isoform X4 [Dipodomys merriami]|uniref:acyl-CoA-binding domain-containing protein 4 isoform X4 n=1 Tax=Dipodomys merriami TaxID=94247 RepID=UPI003855E09E